MENRERKKEKEGHQQQQLQRQNEEREKNTRRLTGLSTLVSIIVCNSRTEKCMGLFLPSFLYKVNKSIKVRKKLLIEHKCYTFEIIIK